MDDVFERPSEYGIYAKEDGKVDAHNDEREYLGTVVDEVEAVEAAGFKDTGDKEHAGKKYGKNTVVICTHCGVRTISTWARVMNTPEIIGITRKIPPSTSMGSTSSLSAVLAVMALMYSGREPFASSTTRMRISRRKI